MHAAQVQEPLGVSLVPVRDSLGWRTSMSKFYYVYPVHTSHSFLVVPSVAAGLYLVMMKLLNLQGSHQQKVMARAHLAR